MRFLVSIFLAIFALAEANVRGLTRKDRFESLLEQATGRRVENVDDVTRHKRNNKPLAKFELSMAPISKPNVAPKLEPSKAPVGKVPVGKALVGKAPLGKAPAPVGKAPGGKVPKAKVPTSKRNVAPEFISRTIVPGLNHDAVNTNVQVGGSEYSAQINLTTAQSGLVSLANAVDLIQSVTCNESGTVHIVLRDLIDPKFLSGMFPVNSILVVSGNIFGSCWLGSPSIQGSDTFATNVTSGQQDGFVVIKSVSGSSRDVQIAGQVVSYFSMFQEGHISIQLLNGELISGNSRKMLTLSDTYSTTYRKSSNLQINVGAKITTIDTGIDVLTADWTLDGGLDISIRLAMELLVQFSASLVLKNMEAINDAVDFVNIEILGVPLLKIYDLLQSNLLKSLPSLTLGLFFKMPLLIKTGFDLSEKGLAAEAKVNIGTGRKEVVFFARGPWQNIVTGVNFPRNDPSSAKATVLSISDTFSNGDSKISLQMFAGVVPQIVLKLGDIIEGKIAVTTGLDFTETIDIGGAFPPLPQSGNALRVGVCDTCHRSRISFDFTRSEFNASATLKKIPGLPNSEISVGVVIPGTNAIKVNLAAVCSIKQYGDDTITCLPVCCDAAKFETCKPTSATTGQCTGTASPTVTPMPIPPPTPPPSPTPLPPFNGKAASSLGDPHLTTYDGLSYDCQGHGEFILIKSLNSVIQVQARFTPPTNGLEVTLTRAVAVVVEGAPTIQIAMAENPNSNATYLESCPILFYVDANQKDLQTGSGNTANVSVVVTGDTIGLAYFPSDVMLQMRVSGYSSFGCYFNVIVSIPDEVIATNKFVGLLGSPNGNFSDDWMTQSGQVLSIPSALVGEEAYQYCTTNWCLKNQNLSHFVYEEGFQFQNFSHCDIPYGSDINLGLAPPELSSLCGVNAACLFDGIVGGLEDAQVTLNDQAVVDRQRSISSPFKFHPAVISTNVSVTVSITLDVSSENSTGGIDGFELYRIDPESGEFQGTAALLTLEDNGSGLGSDLIAGDLIFSNELPVRSSEAGEVFAFRAVPSINGSVDYTSSLVATALSAVRSYSRESGIGSNEPANGGVVTVPSLQGLQLTIVYSWPADVRDLDTATEFLTDRVGYGCGSRTQYMIFSGDNTANGGMETVTVLIDNARQDGAWKNTTSIVLNAGWFGTGRDDGPALVRTVLQNATTNEEVPGSALSLTIDPGSQSGCSSTIVGYVNVVAMSSKNGAEIQLLAQ